MKQGIQSRQRSHWAFAIALALLLLCSCATQRREPSALLPEVTLNKYAGHGDWIMVKLRIWGEEYPFVVDTGMPVTVFDKSLQPRLGPRLGSKFFHNFGYTQTIGAYWTPEIFLSGTRLKTGRHCYAADFEKLKPGKSPIKGVLGMDCLRNYCIQLDFETGKMTFLPSGRMDAAKFDRSIPMKLTGIGCLHLPHGSLIGGKDALLDTGLPGDGMLQPELFKQLVSDTKNSTNTPDKSERIARISKTVWNDATYTNLRVMEVQDPGNLVGLSFLARHRVVLDFPARKMYLKQTSVGPLIDQNFESILGLLKSGRLPRVPKDGHGTLSCRFTGACSAELDVQIANDSSVYHFKIVRASFEALWTMQRGWRTDKSGRIIEEYPDSKADASK